MDDYDYFGFRSFEEFDSVLTSSTPEGKALREKVKAETKVLRKRIIAEIRKHAVVVPTAVNPIPDQVTN